MRHPSQKPLFPDLPLSLLEEAERKARNWGGRRPGSGKRLLPWRKSAPHRPRTGPPTWAPYHVTLSRLPGLPNLRRQETLSFTLRTFQAKSLLPGFRLVAWTLQRNHLHLLVEAASKDHLSQALKSLQIRLARGWNRLWNRRGPVFAGRFHSRLVLDRADALRTLHYVLKNHYRHGFCWDLPFDPASSALWTDVWLERNLWEKDRRRFGVPAQPRPIASPVTPLLQETLKPSALSIFGRPQGRFRHQDLPHRRTLQTPTPTHPILFA